MKAAKEEGGFESFFFLDHARSKAQGFAQHDTYDVRDFAERVVDIAQGTKPKMAQAARDLIAAYDAARVGYCKLGPTVQNSTGLSF